MKEKYVFTNVYGLARSILAFGTIISLSFTSSSDFFPHEAITTGLLRNNIIPNFYQIMGYENLHTSIFISILILCSVISGYLPQITGILQAWISYSFFTGAILVEGGDQITQIITFLLIPITIFDKRLNHWSSKEFFTYKRSKAIEYICYTFFVVIQIQMAIVYLIAGGGKMKSPEWMNGNAFYYWFSHVPFGASGFIKTLFEPIVSNEYIVPLITWGVIGFECILFAAFFMEDPRKKRVLFWMAVLFHFMIVLVHGLVSFYFAMVGGLILYLLPINVPLKFPQISLKSKSKIYQPAIIQEEAA
ncbi:hypothetical protein QNI19_32785 [Cytophagaceae bacterium DM2B3-1]|uniref:HTTM-like domain-containing protein n=1 Tax=Xanthocytophaga flava TaxID=3048013 RepID=A0ABT7CVG5_9BACT|nr:sporulation-delaying protein SdpB family protein [Xanthocytophaga flavus]MDJ1473279.1 hypothetical protein [Xanthocytophaga flavus]MDJ1497763.1 hypothetical protein [Xanthocytophaga flavus]